MARYGLIFILSVCLAGCSFSIWQHANPPEAVVRVNGKVLDPGRLRDGGNILLEPFSPGVDAPANDEVEKIALRIVRGMMDSISGASTTLKILDSSNSGGADLIIKGRIHRYKTKDPALLKKGLISIAVEGEVVELDTGKTIAWFQHSREADGRAVASNLAEVLGADIGNFLMGATVSGKYSE